MKRLILLLIFLTITAGIAQDETGAVAQQFLADALPAVMVIGTAAIGYSLGRVA